MAMLIEIATSRPSFWVMEVPVPVLLLRRLSKMALVLGRERLLKVLARLCAGMS